MFPYRKPILQGLGLAFLLFLISYGFTTIYVFQNMNFLGFNQQHVTIPAIESQTYNWNFSSGLSLSEGFAAQQSHLLSTHTDVQNITFSCLPDCQPDYTIGGAMYQYYNYNTTMLDAVYLTLEAQWRISINRQIQSINANQIYNLQKLPENNLSISLTKDISQLQNLTEVSEKDYNSHFYSTALSGKLMYSLYQVYDSGYRFSIQLVGNQLFMKVERFDRYKSQSPGQMWFESDKSYPEQFFTGDLSQFFPFYTAAVNEFLSLFLEVNN